MIPKALSLAILLFFPLAGTGADVVLTHRQRSLQPGEMIIFEARSAIPLENAVLRAFGREFPAYSETGGLKWTGLVGIDLETRPGRYQVEFLGTGKQEVSAAAAVHIQVAAQKFPMRRLRVEPKYVSPPADVLARIEKERKRVQGIFNSVTPERLWRGPFLRPVPGSVISSFGKRSVYNGKPRSPHAGVDFRGNIGVPIRAPNAGVVMLAADLYHSGKTVIVDHGLGLYSYLGHMSSISVKEGDKIETGALVGKIGATGVVTGPHLHWTVRLLTTRVDPLSILELISHGLN